MLISQYQNTVNTLDREISQLEKKKADKDRECASLQTKISATSKSITKYTSATTAANKLKQIERYQTDFARKNSESADLGKKISDKRKKRNEAYLKLQKAQQDEQKKQEKNMRKLQETYEHRIMELQSRILPPTVSFHNLPLENIDEYDVFISHAFEDKEDFVEEFVMALKKINISVWYDNSQMKWGDSMREKIDAGLKKSKFGIVILSPNYIREGKYWTKTELNGLFQMETINGKTILPIWHNLTKKQVVDYSPTIADRKALTTASMTAQEIALELKALFSSNESEDENNG